VLEREKGGLGNTAGETILPGEVNGRIGFCESVEKKRESDQPAQEKIKPLTKQKKERKREEILISTAKR